MITQKFVVIITNSTTSICNYSINQIQKKTKKPKQYRQMELRCYSMFLIYKKLKQSFKCKAKPSVVSMHCHTSHT